MLPYSSSLDEEFSSQLDISFIPHFMSTNMTNHLGEFNLTTYDYYDYYDYDYFITRYINIFLLLFFARYQKGKNPSESFLTFI